MNDQENRNQTGDASMPYWHFVGVGGIGMSGLAQLCRSRNYRVSGSDRASGRTENRRIFDALDAQEIVVYPQDGSFLEHGRPDALIYSTAVEEDNPDFARDRSIPRLHRSVALQRLIGEVNAECSIAVCGSCGKSTVTAYLAEALLNLGAYPTVLDGALMNRFAYPPWAGNFHKGDGKYFVYEADESDKSLVHYTPDYAILLNLGCDHYPKAELCDLFVEFLCGVRRGAVIERTIYDAIRTRLPAA
ncbi:MAG: Mur ligase domain-containing protein, partial [Victivallaceae bacterium]|nr:Mur ligase domain-containing protein [Victivallaceae bacterium]